MVPNEMDQDHWQKSGREELEDMVQDQIIAKEEEISERREEIRAKEVGIKAKADATRGVEEEIATDLGTKVRKSLEAKLQILRRGIDKIGRGIDSIWQEIDRFERRIIIIPQEINSIREEISRLWSVQEAPALAEPLMIVETMRKLLKDVMEKIVHDSSAKSAISFLSMSFVFGKVADNILKVASFCMLDGSDVELVGDVSVSEGRESDMGRYATEEVCYEPSFERMVKYLTTVHNLKIQKGPPLPRGCCKLLDVHKLKNGL